jgi:hypothetical protein
VWHGSLAPAAVAISRDAQRGEATHVYENIAASTTHRRRVRRWRAVADDLESLDKVLTKTSGAKRITHFDHEDSFVTLIEVASGPAVIQDYTRGR